MDNRISITRHSEKIVTLKNICITSKLPPNNPEVEKSEKKGRSKPCGGDRVK